LITRPQDNNIPASLLQYAKAPGHSGAFFMMRKNGALSARLQRSIRLPISTEKDETKIKVPMKPAERQRDPE
jgi:hypothetical protein